MRGRSSSLRTVKKVLLSLVVVGVIGTVSGRGVMAALSSESVNNQSTASMATFTLNNTIKGQSACSSNTPTGNSNAACTGATGLLFGSTTLRWPGVADYTAVQVQNTGSIDAQSLEVAMTCTNAVTTGASTHLVGTEGTGIPCGIDAGNNSLEFYIQETATLDGANSTNGCLYPDTSNPHVVGQGNTTDCTTQWTADSLHAFWRHTCWDLGRLAAQQTRYFKIGVRFPPDSDNSFQGTQANWTLKWHMVSNDPLYTPACANDS